MKKIICLDTETTGVDRKRDEVLQLSIIDGNGKILFNEYFKPIRLVSWVDAEKVNGISPADVKDCKPILEYKERIEKILRSADVVVGYNLQGFDLPMLYNNGIAYDILHDACIVDVMLSFAPVFGEWNSYRGSYKWQKLQTCAEYYHYSGTQWHDALDDARATLFCFYAMFGNPPAIPEKDPGVYRRKAPHSPAPQVKQKKKTGRVMIAFGILFAIGSIRSLQFGGLLIAVALIFFGFRRYKAFKAAQPSE